MLDSLIRYLRELTEGRHIKGNKILYTLFTLYPSKREWKTMLVIENYATKKIESLSIITKNVLPKDYQLCSLLDEYKN